jgi:cell division septation protein DedD
MPTVDQDTEITLGTGRMLALFFGLVLICAVFFAIGFSLGKKTASMGVASPPAASTEAPSAVVRPSAAKNTQPAPPAEDLSFYKNVGEKNADTALTPQNSQPQAAAPPAAEAPHADTSAAPATAVSATPAPGSYYVQVAAVSRQEDADALVEALKKKQYPAFAANSPADKFYHVQVGPYTDLKEAEAMKARLVGDGYNPIVKR